MGFQQVVLLSILSYVVLGAVTPAVPTKPDNCVVTSADVAFIVDASGSVSQANWVKSLEFAVNVVNGFDIGKDQVRVGLISFSTATKLVFDFNRYNKKSDVISAIRKAPKESSSTYTYRALEQARDVLFQSRSGMRAAAVPKIVFVITDGASQDSAKTIAAAKSLHARKITVFSIGVGGAKTAELNGMASKASYVYSYTDFSKLVSLQDTFRRETCKVVKQLATTRAPAIPTKPKPVNRCSSIKADMVFAVDTSSSVGEGNFNLTKVFLMSMMEKLDFSKISVAIIKFNDGVKTEFNLNSNNNLVSAKRAINAMVYDKGDATRISSALKYMRENSFTPANGDRVNAANIGILVTDGRGKDPYRTQFEANLTKQAGIKLFTIGIGSDINVKELKDIASIPSFYQFVVNYGQLATIQVKLASSLCQGFTVAPVTTAVPCTCKDKEDDCKGYGVDMCYDASYRRFAKSQCAAYCDLCEPGCVRSLPPPVVCKDKVPNCAALKGSCNDPTYLGWSKESCPKTCGKCALLNPPIIIQTTTPTTPSTTTTPTTTTTVKQTTPPPPTKPTPFVPCDLNCYDTKRDCDGYDKALCQDPAYIGFFKTNCKLTCGYCTEKSSCVTSPPLCANKPGVDCASFDDKACVEFPGWAKETCPRRCGYCPGQTPVVLVPTTPPPCVDLEDCTRYGDDVCTDFPDYSKKNCRQFCGICVGVTTPRVCDNKIDCSKFDKASCAQPDFRKYMFANCRLFCNACNDDN